MELDNNLEHIHIKIKGVADEDHHFNLDLAKNLESSSDNYNKLI